MNASPNGYGGDDSGSRSHWESVDPGHVEIASSGTDQNQACGMTVTSFGRDPARAGDNLANVRRPRCGWTG